MSNLPVTVLICVGSLLCLSLMCLTYNYILGFFNLFSLNLSRVYGNKGTGIQSYNLLFLPFKSEICVFYETAHQINSCLVCVFVQLLVLVLFELTIKLQKR